MRDLTFTGLKAHPLAVLIMFVLSTAVFSYGCFDISSHLNQVSQLNDSNFLTLLKDRTNGKGYLLSGLFTLLLTLYAVGGYRSHAIYRWLSWSGIGLAVAFIGFILII
ncbi:hypothetical protein K6Y31_11240 [Motilimonas cestriensis]|uniref:Uncharacterized protein n=1 Tax=Motilimonas cestriensis TaxID=2742685 RepID=A0ABS8WA75_9GAMM|nr:hypothetical protein [Motilimonas cestriensis]MCE2595390.1 hypothetical protein [Motilimonas cestriensis]